MIGWHIVRLMNEGTGELTGSILETIRFASSSNRILFTFGSPRGKRLVVIGVQAPRPTLYWVHRKADLPDAASYEPSERFNRLRNARLVGADLPNADRLIRLDFERIRDDGIIPYNLWIGWLGGAGNLWLVDATTGRLLEVLRKTQSTNLNEPFQPPSPPALIDWRPLSFPTYLTERERQPDQPLADFLRKRMWGIDAEFSKRVGWLWDQMRAEDHSESLIRSRWREYSTFMSSIRLAVNAATPLCVSESERGRPIILPCDSSDSHASSHPTLAIALARSDKEIARTEGRESRVAAATAELRARAAQLRRRLAAIDKIITDGGRADAVKHEGDLLGANRHLLRKGTREVVVTDWTSGEECRIVLDPALNAQENIDAFYQRARKLARGAETARAQRGDIETDLRETEAELARFEAGEIEAGDIRETLRSDGDSGARGRETKGDPARRVPYREFTIGKYIILVGKSRKDNDELTLHVARPYDLFLHADRVGGSHVIVRQPEKGRDFPPEVLATAARAAAFFSKAKHSSLVPVIYTEVRYVTKPRKAPAGLVRVTNEKSLMVEPAPPPGYHDGQIAE